ncbi:MAG: hypothetical protein WCK29_00440 [archaeon]
MEIDTNAYVTTMDIRTGHKIIHTYNLRHPAMAKHILEQNVTNGLGYKPIEHYEDSQLGLTRHLFDMEIRCAQSERIVTQQAFFQAFKDLLAYEDHAHDFADLAKLGMKVSKELRRSYDELQEDNRNLRNENLELKKKGLQKKKGFFERLFD